MDVVRVLDDDHALALGPAVVQFRDSRRAIGEQPGAVLSVAPRTGNHAGTVERAEFVLVPLDEGVDALGLEQPRFDEQRLDCFDPNRWVSGVRCVRVVATHVGSI